MAYFQTKNPTLGKFWRDCNGSGWSILSPFGLFCGHLEYFMVTRYIFTRFGTLSQEKSGNPDSDPFAARLIVRRQLISLGFADDNSST
jgi:hypothetical protein